MHTAKTWLLIADAGHARVLETVGIGNPLVEVPSMRLAAELPRTRDLMTDRLPRTQDSAGPSRHAIAPRTDPHRELKRAFAVVVAELLEAEATAGSFGRLVVVAPPAMLGDLRACMSKSLSNCIAAEVAKDLVKTPDHEIRSHLREVVAI